jgi:carbamoyltransferase
MIILGISAFYHDSAAALIIDGKIITAIEEERLTRIKHDNQFPHMAIAYCLASQGLTIDDIDAVAYYEKPLLKFERLLETFVSTYPRALAPFLRAIPDWLGTKIKVENIIKNILHFKKAIYYIPHHTSHAAAAYYTSAFSRAAILTVDGVGEYQTTALWGAKKETLALRASINFPDSLGLLYSTFTAFLGFKVNEDEYKVMGLSAYGSPVYADKIKELIDYKPDGSFKLSMDYFSFREAFQMWNRRFGKLFGKPRKPHEPILKFHKDIAASIQYVTEEILFAILNHLRSITGETNLCLSGGVALNALANGKIYEKTKFKNVHIFGPAGDSGTAIGAALYTYHKILTNKKHHQVVSLSLGSSYSNNAIENILIQHPVKYKKIGQEKELIRQTAILLRHGHILGWFQGCMEFGPRALGNRSILALPNPRSMKEKVNIIKHREQFRPFAGSILEEYVFDYFEVPTKLYSSPYMNFCFPVRADKRKALAAIVHKDNTCRIQTVSRENGRYYMLIAEVHRQTGLACILNTSFNLQGEPIVEHPRQAIEDFLKTNMDDLVIGDFIVSKKRKG